MERIAAGESVARFRLGSMVVTALCDGYVDMPPKRLRQPGNRPFGDDLPDQIPLHGGKLRLSVNAFLVEADGKLALVDTGAADAWLPSMGRLPQALEEAGVDAARITMVALTHTHEDHINGLVLPGGGDAFPNLDELWVPEAEVSLFRAEPRLARFRDRATPFRPGEAHGGLIEVVAASGHEVGHSCFRVGDGSGELLIWGDTVHVPSIQFERPELTWEFDADQDLARSSRRRLLEWAAQEDCWVAGAHLDWPGVGKVHRDGTGFRFLPL
jgi:glyoxylase-like metal-dependent hydrolase (beta-lactamase superfamily II)